MSESHDQTGLSVVLDHVERSAADAVRILGVTAVITDASDTVFEQIEDCHTFATASGDSDAIFLALSLPIANGIIHYGTSRHAMADARSWVRQNWPEATDVASTLAFLTLIHIVHEGRKRYRDDPEKRETWAKIQGRVAKLFRGQHPVAA